jgi:hypothetical protein
MTPRQLSMLATEHGYVHNPKARRPLDEQAKRPESQGTAAFAVALGAKAAEARGHGATPT